MPLLFDAVLNRAPGAGAGAESRRCRPMWPGSSIGSSTRIARPATSRPPMCGPIEARRAHQRPQRHRRRGGSTGGRRGIAAGRPASAARPRPSAVALVGARRRVLLAAAALVYPCARTPVTPPSEVRAAHRFRRLGHRARALSPDGRMVAFIRGGEFFLSSGQIYVKLLPNGDAVTTHQPSRAEVRARVHARRLARRLHAAGSARRYPASWDTWTVATQGGEPSLLLPNAAGLVWLDPTHRAVLGDQASGPPHGHRDVDGSTCRPPRDLLPRARTRDGALLVAVARSPVGAAGRNGSDGHLAAVPARAVRRERRRPAGRARGSMHWPPGGRPTAAGCTSTRRSAAASTCGDSGFPMVRPSRSRSVPRRKKGSPSRRTAASLVTSVGQSGGARSGFTTPTGERAVTSEGFADAPRLSNDGRRVFYLSRQPAIGASEIWTTDLASGRTERALPGIAVSDFAIAPDEREVAYTVRPGGGRFAGVAGGARSALGAAPGDRRELIASRSDRARR